MRPTRTALILLMLAVMAGCSRSLPDTEEEAAGLVEQLYSDSLFAEATDVVDRTIETYGASERLLAKKYKILLAQEKYEDALRTFELIIGIVGDRPDIVIDKLRLLRRLGRFDEALGEARRLYEEFPNETPYICLEASKVCIESERAEDGLMWLERSVQQGFSDFEYLLEDQFALLRDEARFAALVERMKSAAGIGLPARDFSVPLFGGGVSSRSDHLGKVVLIDFWATWCVPCVSEHPNLAEMYSTFKADGFEIVSVSADTDSSAVSRFLAEHPSPWVVGYSGKGREDKVIGAYGIDSFPTYVILDRQGVVRYVSSTGGEKLRREIQTQMERSS